MYQDAEKYVLAMLQYALEYTDTEKIERFLKMVTTKLAKPEGEKIMYAAEYLRQEGRKEGFKMAQAEFVSAAEHLRQEGRRMAEAEFKDVAKHLRQEGRQEALRQKAEDYAKLVKNLGDEAKAAEVLEISLAELRAVLAIKETI